MSQNHDWRKADAWQDGPAGFGPTLSPDDPRAISPVSGTVVRDNRRQVVLQGMAAAREQSTAAAVTPVSGLITRPRPQIPVAQVTREATRDTHRNSLVEHPQEVVPDFASEYVPPQPLPEVSQHKTFELRPVRLAPDVHPRTAPTVLNLRTQHRHHQKQEKDERELAVLLAQSQRRRRGPWIALVFICVAILGFLVGTLLVGASQAETSIRPDPASPELVSALITPAATVEPARATTPPPEPAASPARRPQVGTESKPSPKMGKVAAKPKKSAVTADSPEPQARPHREVWLK